MTAASEAAFAAEATELTTLLLQLARRRAVEVLTAIVANPVADPKDRAQARQALIRDLALTLKEEGYV